MSLETLNGPALLQSGERLGGGGGECTPGGDQGTRVPTAGDDGGCRPGRGDAAGGLSVPTTHDALRPPLSFPPAKFTPCIFLPCRSQLRPVCRGAPQAPGPPEAGAARGPPVGSTQEVRAGWGAGEEGVTDGEPGFGGQSVGAGRGCGRALCWEWSGSGWGVLGREGGCLHPTFCALGQVVPRARFPTVVISINYSFAGCRASGGCRE